MIAFMFIFFVLLAPPGSTVQALPTNTSRLLTAPLITYPAKDAVWTVGSRQNVTWDVSKIPSAYLDVTVQIILGSAEVENLEFVAGGIYLATNVSLRTGYATFTVPNYSPGNYYIICLLEVSRSTSPGFAILGGEEPPPPIPYCPSSISFDSSVISTPVGPSTVEMSSSNAMMSSTDSPTSFGAHIIQTGNPLPTATRHTNAAFAAYTYDNSLFSLAIVFLAAYFL